MKSTNKKPSNSHALAALGAPPLFTEPIYVGRPNIPDTADFLERAKAILQRKWLTNHGPEVRNFEEHLCDATGAKHCIALCNATVALEILCNALELKGEVVMPAWTFAATAHAATWVGLTPVFCDVDPKTHNLCSKSVEPLITQQTSAIIGVHLWGRSSQSPELDQLARERHLPLIYDAAHAFSLTGPNGRRFGELGTASVFSFHATKAINSFEGGAIATNDDELAKRVRLISNFGFAGYDHVVSIGTNGKMCEISAAMGLCSLAAFPQIVAANRLNYETYRNRLSALPGISLVEHPDYSNFHYAILEIDSNRFGLTRDQLMVALHKEQVIARRYFFPGVHQMEPYRSHRQSHLRQPIPATELLSQTCLALPNGTSYPSETFQNICDLIEHCHERRFELASVLPSSVPLHP